MTKRVVVTGSTGNLGQKAVACLRQLGDWEIVAFGMNPLPGDEAIAADLSRYDQSWAQHFSQAEAVLHLAGEPTPFAPWDPVVRDNIDLGLNVFRAAEAGGVRRFVFASSNWVLGGYRFSNEPLNSSLPPKPVGPYGSSKLFLERYGASVAARTEMSVLSLRIGYCQAGENLPGKHMVFGAWGQQAWLGNKDWAQAVKKSITQPFQGSAALNIVSRNKGMRWDLEEARQVIGFEPEEGHVPSLALQARVKDIGARIRDMANPLGFPSFPFRATW